MDLASLATDDAQEARALGRAIDLADDFALLLARCDSRPRIRELQEALTARPVLRIEVPPGTTSPLRLLDAAVPNGFDGAIYLEGLETWISSDTNPDSVAFFLNLNAGRDRLAADFPYPLVLWAPGYLLSALAGAAPDFFSVRSGYYSFDSQSEKPADFVSLGSSATEIHGLSIVDKLERIARIERLLQTTFSEEESERNKSDRANLYAQLGYLHHTLGEHEQALAAHQAAASLDRSVGGEDYAVARDLNNIGHVLYSQGDLDGALGYYRDAEGIVRGVGTGDNPLLAAVLSNAGLVFQEQGKFSTALDHFKAAESIDRSTLGDTHPNVARDVNNAGTVLRQLGDSSGALQRYQEAERLYRTAYGDDHPHVAAGLNNLGSILREMGDLSGALRNFLEAERIDRTAYGDEHPSVARDTNNIAGILLAQNDLDGARVRYQNGLQILIRKNGVRGQNTVQAARNLLTIGGDPIAEARKVVPEEVVQELARALAGEKDKPI